MMMEHVALGYNRMTINILSESVANALFFSDRKDVRETIKFVKYFDEFFDSLMR